MIVSYDWNKHSDACRKIAKKLYYPLLWEDDEAFQTKIRVFPKGCVVYVKNEQVLGYGFGHPWRQDRPVELNEYITLPEKPNCYYIHDVAVDPAFKKQGIGRVLVKHQLKIAEELGLDMVCLVSVLNSDKFWERFGFRAVKYVKYAKGVKGYVMWRI